MGVYKPQLAGHIMHISMMLLTSCIDLEHKIRKTDAYGYGNESRGRNKEEKTQSEIYLTLGNTCENLTNNQWQALSDARSYAVMSNALMQQYIGINT